MHGQIAYFEIPTEDADRAKTFYGSLFGWSFSSSHIENYAMIDAHTMPAGLSAGEPSASPMRLFFEVDAIEEAVADVERLGGQSGDIVTLPSGRFCRCHDDQGLAFTLWQDAR